MFDFRRALQFTSLLEQFQKVTRKAYVPGEDRMENDVEHSYKLAMMAWYLVEAYKLPLDTNKIAKYALAHDFVEVHAGDTVVWDAEAVKTKHAREEAAQKKLAADWKDFPGLHSVIEAYENKEDEEARFVYALDKLFFLFPEYLADWKTILELRVSSLDMLENKMEKTKIHPVVHEWCLDVFSELKRKGRLW